MSSRLEETLIHPYPLFSHHLFPDPLHLPLHLVSGLSASSRSRPLPTSRAPSLQLLPVYLPARRHRSLCYLLYLPHHHPLRQSLPHPPLYLSLYLPPSLFLSASLLFVALLLSILRLCLCARFCARLLSGCLLCAPSICYHHIPLQLHSRSRSTLCPRHHHRLFHPLYTFHLLFYLSQLY